MFDCFIGSLRVWIVILFMELLASFDFLSGVNPTLKLVVYILIALHLAAVGAWCVLACPSMFKKTDSFADKVEKAMKEKGTKYQ